MKPDDGPSANTSQGNSLTPTGGQQSTLNTASEKALGQEISNALEKIDALTKDLEKQDKAIGETKNTVNLGFIILIAVVGSLILSAVIFEIQTIRDNHQQIMLLQEQSKSN